MNAIRVANEHDRPRAIAVLVAGFLADPVARWCWPESDVYLENSAGFMDAFGGRAFRHDSAYVDEGLFSTALWLPPGVTPDDEALGQIIEATVDPKKQGALFSALEQLSTYRPEEDHWYLPAIGVDPVRQGQGLGSSLMKYALARCDESARPAYLESTNPRNIPLYERYGFRIVGEVRCGDDPVFTPMVRDAADPDR